MSLGRNDVEQLSRRLKLLHLPHEVLNSEVDLGLVPVAQALEDEVEHQWIALAAIKDLTLKRALIVVEARLVRIGKGILPDPLDTLT